MATYKVGDLGLGDVLEAMCNNDDHVIVLKILQTLSTVRRAGYMTIEELVGCLSYCCNCFASNGNYAFFEEFVLYMPDITSVNATSPFSVQSKSYYFSAKNGNAILNNLQDICTNLDVDELKPWFRDYLIQKGLYLISQLEPLLRIARKRETDLSNKEFQVICQTYNIPIVMRTGTDI